jgi:hypothetical protein
MPERAFLLGKELYMASRIECDQVKTNENYITNAEWFASQVLDLAEHPRFPANTFSQVLDATSELIGSMNDTQVVTLLGMMDALTKRSDFRDEFRIGVQFVNDAMRELAFVRGLVEGEDPFPSDSWSSYEPKI